MGREVRRVALDFQWPLHQVWEGFINPHHESVNCPHCEGSGAGPEARALHQLWYGYVPFDPASTGSTPFTEDTPEVRWFAERNYPSSSQRLPYEDPESMARTEARRLIRMWNNMWSHHLSQADVDVLVAEGRLRLDRGLADFKAETVNRWSLCGFGHDCINQWIVTKARVALEGKAYECAHCGGEGYTWKSEEGRLRQESWVQIEPPAGEGYQIWETVSEGSPISPVFADPQQLATWMTRYSRGLDANTSCAQWLKFITGPGWAPSMIGLGGQVLSGVEAVTSE